MEELSRLTTRERKAMRHEERHCESKWEIPIYTKIEG
jgi:hypothetical protein